MNAINKWAGITNDFPLPELRACKGIIKDHDGENWILHVLQEDATKPPRIVAVPPKYLRLVPEEWLAETRAAMFDQMAMLAHFRGPSLEGPVPRFNEQFRSRTACPNTTTVEAFYGCNIFPSMNTRLQEQLMWQSKKGTLWNFTSSRPLCGIVFTDGRKQTQRTPYTGELCSCWWPVLYVPDPVSYTHLTLPTKA